MNFSIQLFQALFSTSFIHFQLFFCSILLFFEQSPKKMITYFLCVLFCLEWKWNKSKIIFDHKIKSYKIPLRNGAMHRFVLPSLNLFSFSFHSIDLTVILRLRRQRLPFFDLSLALVLTRSLSFTYSSYQRDLKYRICDQKLQSGAHDACDTVLKPIGR